MRCWFVLRISEVYWMILKKSADRRRIPIFDFHVVKNRFFKTSIRFFQKNTFLFRMSHSIIWTGKRDIGLFWEFAKDFEKKVDQFLQMSDGSRAFSLRFDKLNPLTVEFCFRSCYQDLLYIFPVLAPARIRAPTLGPENPNWAVWCPGTGLWRITCFLLS